MDNSIRMMVELGKKKRVVACAFDWPGWDRSAKTEEHALRVLAAYRPRYAKVAALAGLADEFGATGEPAVVERLEGNGMTDYYGVSGRIAGPEQAPMAHDAVRRRQPERTAVIEHITDRPAEIANRPSRSPSPEAGIGSRRGGRSRETSPRS